MIVAEVDEGAVAGADVLVETRGHQPFVGEIVDVGLKLQSARSSAGESDRAVASATRQIVGGARGAGGAVVDAEDLIVEGNLGGVSGRGEICEGGRLELRTGDIHRRSGGNEQAQALGIDEEEGLVFDDGPT